jgi:(p)ppGpp synthase/HD superfamily hydrolase
MLEEAIQLAVEAHRGQVDRFQEEPYILHPLHVMMQFTHPAYRIVGVLHDVLEDGPQGRDFYLIDLSTRFPQEIVNALDSLTRRDSETYAEYISRVAENKIAKEVKIADLIHNIDRLPEGQLELSERYQRAMSRLRRSAIGKI